MPHPILAVLSEGQCAYPQLCGSCSEGALILFIASSVLYISCAMHFFMCAAEGIRDALLGVWEEAPRSGSLGTCCSHSGCEAIAGGDG